MGNFEPLKHALAYRAWGALAKLAIGAYFVAPREMLQDELFNLHRIAIRKAHDHRVKGESLKAACNHEKALQWDELQWCRRCGAIKPIEAQDVPTDQWTGPTDSPL